MKEVLVEVLKDCIINSVAWKAGSRFYMHEEVVQIRLSNGEPLKVVEEEVLTFTREQAELLVTKNFPSETPTYATPMRAYDGDQDPAWVVLTSSDHVFLVDRVSVVKYEKSKEIAL